MRWIPYILLIYVALIVQTTLGKLLTLPGGALGAVGPDFIAILVVFVALQARSGLDVALAAWVAGLGLDLTAGGGLVSSTAIGAMSIGYVAAAAALVASREAFFREHALTQAFFAMLFCCIAHGVWVTLQALRVGAGGWSAYGMLLLKVLAVSAFTAALTPLGHFLLGKCQRFILAGPSTRSRR